jgi:hypothetical protein
MSWRTLISLTLALAAMAVAQATAEFNLANTSLATVSGSPVNGNRPIDNPYYGVLNLFDEGTHFINGLNYDYWLGEAPAPNPQWVEVRFSAPVTVTSLQVTAPLGGNVGSAITQSLQSSEVTTDAVWPYAIRESELGTPITKEDWPYEMAPPTQSEAAYPSDSEAASSRTAFDGRLLYRIAPLYVTVRLYGAEDKELAAKTLPIGVRNISPATLSEVAPVIGTDGTAVVALTPGNMQSFDPAVTGVTRARLEIPGQCSAVNEWSIMGTVPEGTVFTIQPPHITRTAEGSNEAARIACPAWIKALSVDAGYQPTTEETATAFVTTFSKDTQALCRISVDKETGAVSSEELVTVVLKG